MPFGNIIIRQEDSNEIFGSRDNLILNVPITLINDENDVFSYLWQFIDKPSGSTAILSTPTQSSTAFYPDKEGTYLISLILNNGAVVSKIGAAIKTTNLHFRIPAALEDGEFNSTRGWGEAVNDAFSVLDDGYGNLLNNLNNKGTVTAIDTSSRLTGGPLTTSGTLDLAPSGVAAGTKNGFTFDAYGRIIGTPSDHLIADGYTINLSHGITTGQVLSFDGSNITPSTPVALTPLGVPGTYGDGYTNYIGSLATDAYGRVIGVVTHAGNTINVKDYGAKGDGATDDTAAIQSAIDSRRDKGGVIYFPAGTYLISSQIKLDDSTGHSYANITLMGTGYLSCVKASVAITDLTNLHGMFYFHGSTAYSQKNVGIRNLRISGYDEVTPSGQLIYFGNSDGSFLIDSFIDTTRNEGVYWNDPGDSQNITIRGNYATRIGGWGSSDSSNPLSAYNCNANNVQMSGNRSYQCGLAVEQTGSGGYITNNIFEYCGLQSGTLPQKALSLQSTQAGSRLIVDGNTIRFANYAISFGSSAVGEFEITNNIIESCNEGILLGNTTTTAVVRYNYFYDIWTNNNGAAIDRLSGSVGAIIENNIIAAGPTGKWAYVYYENATTADIVRGNVIVGNVATTSLFHAGTSNTGIQFLRNTVIPATMADGFPRYVLHGVNITKTSFAGVDGDDVILSSIRPSEIRSSAIPTVGTWSVGDIVINATPTATGIDRWICTGAGTPGVWTPEYVAYQAGTGLSLSTNTFSMSAFGPGAVTTGDSHNNFIASITTDAYGRINALTTHAAPWINVKDYGAKGDGYTNDVVAIQAAIDTIRDIGGVVYFPSGTYIVNSPINVSGLNIGINTPTGHNYNNITLLGDGYQSCIKAGVAFNTIGGIVNFSGDYRLGNYSQTNSGIRKMRISGFDETTPMANGTMLVFFQYCSGSFLIDCYLDTCPYEGVAWQDPAYCKNVTCTGNYATRIGGWTTSLAGPLSAYNINCTTVLCSNNYSFQCGQAIEQTGFGATITNNIFEYTGYNFGTTGIYYGAINLASTQNSGKTIVSNNTIKMANVAIGISDGYSEYVISDNIIENCDFGISASNNNVYPFLISNNYIYGAVATSSGEAISYTATSTGIGIIENNTIVSGSINSATQWAYAILIGGSTTQAIVRNNTIKGRTTTQIFKSLSGNSNIQWITNSLELDNFGTGVRYDYLGGSFTDGYFSGIDHGTVLSTKQPSIVRGSSLPATGTWKIGDIVINAAPTATGIDRWICTGAGTPGIWTPEYVEYQAGAGLSLSTNTFSMSALGPGAITTGDAQTKFIGSIVTDAYGRISNLITNAATWANVKDYGAKGDGYTDDTAAMQSAIDSVRDTGGVVFFPAGVYILRNPGLKIFKTAQHAYDGVFLVGTGYASQIKWAEVIGDNAGGGNIAGIYFKGILGATDVQIQNVGIRSIRLTGFDTTTLAGPLVLFNVTNKTFVVDSWIENNSTEGIYWNSPTRDINHIGEDNAVCIGNHATNIGGYGVSPANGPLSAYNINSNNGIVANCYADSCGQAIEAVGTGLIIANNRFSNIASGVALTPGVALNLASTFPGTGFSVVGNRIKNVGVAISLSSITATQGAHIFSGNIFENVNMVITAINSATITFSGGSVYDTCSSGVGSSAVFDHGQTSTAPMIVKDVTITAGTTGTWAYAILERQAANYSQFQNNTVDLTLGNGFNAGVFSTGASSSAWNTEFIDNKLIRGSLGNTFPIYQWRNTSISKSVYAGVDTGVTISTLRPSTIRAAAAPVTGTWSVGDIVINTTPTATGIDRWICTSAGTPGIWTPEYVQYASGAGLTLTTNTFSLPTVGPSGTGGTYGSGTGDYIGQIVADAYGRITGITTRSNSRINVKDFGAKGDGSTDDRAAIQAAIDSLRDTGGGYVHFPAGTYIIGAQVKLSNIGGHRYDGIILSGDGYVSHIKPNVALLGGGGTGPFFIQGASAYDLKNVGFMNLRISGFDETTIGVGPVISFANTDTTFAINCWIDTNRDEGLYWNNPNDSQNVYITGCHITRVGGWADAVSGSDPRSAYNVNAHNANVVGNFAFQCGFFVEHTGSGGAWVANVFEYAALRGTTGSPIYQVGGLWESFSAGSSAFNGRIVVANNTFRYAGTGISIGANSTQSIIVTGNSIEFCNAGINCGSSNATVVVDNNYIFDTIPSGLSQGAALTVTAGSGLFRNNTIVAGATPWAYIFRITDGYSAAIVKDNIIYGNAVTSVMFDMDNPANTSTEFINNIIVDPTGSIPGARIYYRWQGLNYTHDLFHGIGRGTVLSTQQPSIIYTSTAPTVGVWKVGDIAINTTPTATGINQWICTSSGTPGTWTAQYTIPAPTTVGNIIAANGSSWVAQSKLIVDVRDYNSLSTAITAQGSTPTTITIPNTQTVPASLSVPSTVHLAFTGAGSLSIANAQTVTINGPLTAPLTRIFSGAGVAVLSSTAPITVYPEWWGAVSDGYTDCAAAINAAVNAIRQPSTGTGGKVKFSRGSYGITTWVGVVQASGNVLDGNNIIFEGEGREISEIHALNTIGNIDGTFPAAMVLFIGYTSFTLKGITVRDLKLRGFDDHTEPNGRLILTENCDTVRFIDNWIQDSPVEGAILGVNINNDRNYLISRNYATHIGGWGHAPGPSWSGALAAYNPTATNLKMVDNVAYQVGMAIEVVANGLQIMGNHFEDCSTGATPTYQYAMSIASTGKAVDAVISNNIIRKAGVGIRLATGTGTGNVVISSNTLRQVDAGIYVTNDDSPVLVANNTITDTITPGSGPGACISHQNGSTAPLIVKDNVITAGPTGTWGYGITTGDASIADIIEGNTAIGPGWNTAVYVGTSSSAYLTKFIHNIVIPTNAIGTLTNNTPRYLYQGALISKSQIAGIDLSTTIIAATEAQKVSATTTPTVGVWQVGDIVINTTPTATGIDRWICTGAGTPGVWTPIYVGYQAGPGLSLSANTLSMPAVGPGTGLIGGTGSLYTNSITLDAYGRVTAVTTLDSGVFNVKSFGAVGDGVTNDYVAIQAAIDAACTVAAQGGIQHPPTVYFPAGEYLNGTQPWRVYAKNVVLSGPHGSVQAHLRSTFGTGPLVVIAPSISNGYTGIPIVAGITADGGNAIQLPTNGTQWFNLRIDGRTTCDLNGLTAFTAELWIKPTALPGGPCNILSSTGRRGINEAQSYCFALYQAGTTIGAYLTVAGTRFSLTSGSVLSIGVAVHIALTYDGTTIRLFVAGVLAASTTTTGTLTQTLYEDVTLGPAIQDWPETTILWSPFQGVIDSTKLSNTAQYTTAFTPSNHKLSVDSHTLLCLNWATQVDIFTFGISALGGSGYYAIRTSNVVGSASVSRIAVKNLKIDASNVGNALYAFYTQVYKLENLELTGGMAALYLWGNCYEGRLVDITTLGGQIGVGAVLDAGVIQSDGLKIIGSTIQLVIGTGSMLLNQPYFAPSTSTVICVLMKGQNSAAVMNMPLFDVEGAGANFLYDLFLSATGVGKATIIGGDFTSLSAHSPIVVDSIDQLTLIDNIFSTSSESAIVNLINNPSQPIAFINNRQRGTSIPWASNLSQLVDVLIYTPTTPAQWASPPPSTYKAAIDRLAAAIFAINGVPIP